MLTFKKQMNHFLYYKYELKLALTTSQYLQLGSRSDFK
jgi:hypothetical protein